MNFRNLILLFCVSILFVNSFPIGKDNESEETETETESSLETTTEAENEGTDSQEVSCNLLKCHPSVRMLNFQGTLEDQLNEVEEDPSTRKKRGLYSSERTEEEIEISHGVHHREKRHAEHLPHPDHPTPVKRSSDHHRIKRSEGHPHVKRSSPHTPEGHVAVMAKDDHHGHEKRNSEDHHGHQKRSADDHHGHEKRSADDHHGHQKRSEHVEHHLEMHDHQKRNTPEGHGEHHLVKRSGSEGGHRHHRSTDQGHDEDEPEDEIQTDETEETTEESETRKRRNTDTPLPTFPSDHDASEHSNSVAIRVKRVSRAGSSHKVRTLNKNRGNSKAGETTQNDSLSPNSGGVFNS
ncbi:CRE-NLP-16 protein [Caenorhabditis remanei]|uniref:CRE-NLP-16 protein n=1 Tax=Caenorhabditis remanei TaxID=31234 RepID=E3MSA6_CAERE|nr:CRE-NLP-16 protein [Caenorhabditis remanei]